MRSAFQSQLRSGFIATALMGTLIASCSGVYAPQSASESVESSGDAAVDEIATLPHQSGEVSFVVDVPQTLPQLVKRAELAVEVESVDNAIRQATAIARTTGGDLLNLQNQSPPNETIQHTAFLELRVPQTQLESVMQQLSELGTVERQSISAEDVSAQLVDYESRLRNLRKSEEMVLEIMERSGDIGEVLQVAQELRTIRGSIEQIDGQLNSLKNRVNYSTIQLNLIGEVAAAPSQTTIMTQLSGSWTGATRSVAELTVDLLQLGIWLMVYSPYFLAIGGMGWLGYRFMQRDRQSAS